MGVRDPKKNWFLTYPQNETAPQVLVDKLKLIDKVIEYVVARETHADGGKHLHAYVKFVTGVKLKDAPVVFDLIGKSGNYQPCRSCKSVIKYCTKDGDYLSNFDLDKYKAKQGKVTSATLRTYTAIEALDQGIIGLNSIKAYEYARSLAVEPHRPSGLRGVWYHGEPGVGKSYHARRVLGESVYLKPQNKWWDGYTGQENVLLEDLDVKSEKNSGFYHLMKLWSDRYPCSGEIKGGQVALAHDKFVVTSNYKPDELIKEDDHLLEAICRRFDVIEVRKVFIPPEQRVGPGEWGYSLTYPDGKLEYFEYKFD